MIRDMISYGKSSAPKPLTAAQRKNPRAATLAAKRAGGFVWIGLEDPDAKEMGELAEALGLHPLPVADAVTGKQQPKIQSFDDHLFVVLWALMNPGIDKPVTVGEVFVFVRDGMLLTVQRNAGKQPLEIEKIFRGVETQLAEGAVGGLYGIMSHVSAGYTETASDVEKELEKIETQVFDNHRKESGERIYRLRQQIGKLQRAVSSLASALEASKDHLGALVVGHEKLEPYLRDLLDDLSGTGQLVSDQGAALDGVLSSHENNVASQQNDDTRKISAFAALLSVPTVLAGLYGMNFKNLPGVRWSFGWLAVVVAVLVLDAIMFVNFKKRHWL